MWKAVESQQPVNSNRFVPDLDFTKKDKTRFQRQLEKLGVQENGWYVCLHVRDGGYHSDWASRRNADIRTYLPAVRAIVDRGGVVIRMGDSRMQPAPSEAGLIDYALSDYKDEWFDMFLIKNCRLYMGMQSGILDSAILFGRQLLITNMDCFTFWPLLKAEDRGIFKHLFSSELERNLTAREMLSLPFRFRDFALGQNDSSLTPITNSPEEIHAAVVESLAITESTVPSELQQQFRTARNELIRSEIDKFVGQDVRKDDLMYLNRNALRVSSEGTLSQEFLAKHFN